MLDDKDISFTRELYRTFYKRYPDDNPTDINTLNKYKFMQRKLATIASRRCSPHVR